MHVAEVDDARDLVRFPIPRAHEDVVVVRVGVNHRATEVRQGGDHDGLEERQTAKDQGSARTGRRCAASEPRAHSARDRSHLKSRSLAG